MEEKEEQVKKETHKKSIVEWMEENPKKTFCIRAALWTILAAILPFSFIAWRFEIFSNSKTQITGWGIIGIVIIVVFLFVAYGYLKKGLKQSLLKQCLVGFIGVTMPLVMITLLVSSIASNSKQFEEALLCITLCETLALPVNPFPDWLEKQRIARGKEQTDSILEAVKDKFFNKNEEDKK